MAEDAPKSVPKAKLTFLRKMKIAAGLGAAALLVFHATPHLFPHLTRKMFELKPKQEVPEEHKSRVREACYKMGVKDPQRVDVFFSSGFGTISAGCCDLPNKAVIGLPRSFLLDDVETLRNTGVKFQDTAIKWDSKCGRALEKALVMKKEYISFTAAHELAHITNYDFVYRCLLPTTWFYSSCRLFMWIVPRAQGAPTTGLKILLTVMLSGISYFGYVAANKYMKHELEFRADQVAAKCGVEYCDGGISYLKSHLRVNRVIRHMTGAEGFQRYNKKGDDLHDDSHPMITERIRRLNNIKEQYTLNNKIVA